MSSVGRKNKHDRDEDGKIVRTKQSPIMLFIISLILILGLVASISRTLELRQKAAELAVKESVLNEQLAEAKLKSEQLQEKELYMQTMEYIEDEAKSKLGLVYPDEIIIKPREKEY